MTRILVRSDVEAVLTLEECIEAVEEAFRAYGEGRLAAPQSLGAHGKRGTFHIKAAMANHFVAKINANFPENRANHGLPTIQGVIYLADVEQGTTLAILDSALITVLRTAAATAVAAKYLSRTDSRVMTLIGCGQQAAAQVAAIATVRSVQKLFVFDLDRDAIAILAEQVKKSHGIDVQTDASLDDAVAVSEIVVTCTSSKEPILQRHHVHSGLFIAAVGADNPAKSELSPELLTQCVVVPDFTEQAITMGDTHHAIEAGLLTRERLHGELAQVICGNVSARSNDDECFVFDSTGTALQDLVAASLAYQRALERGIGLDVAFSV